MLTEGWESRTLGKGAQVSGTLSSWHGLGFSRWEAFCLAMSSIKDVAQVGCSDWDCRIIAPIT